MSSEDVNVIIGIVAITSISIANLVLHHINYKEHSKLRKMTDYFKKEEE